MNYSDKQKILQHFADRLSQRYNIIEQPDILQKAFCKRLEYPYILKFNTRLIHRYRDRAKRAYITKFKGQEVLFIYNHEIGLAKTALTKEEGR